MSRTKTERYRIFKYIQKYPKRFIRKSLGIKQLTKEQETIIDSVWNNRRTVVPSAHSMGKSFIGASIVLAFLYGHKNSIVITTAPTYRQVKDILWKNIREMHENAKGLKKIVPNILNLDLSENWYALGFATTPGADEVSAVKFQGYHAKHILVVLDEAGGLQPAIWEAVDGILSGQGGRCLAIGNPSQRNTPFYKASTSDKWHNIELSALDHPNVMEKKEIIEGAVSYNWVSEKVDEWCEITDSKVPGSFTFEGAEYIPNSLFKWKVLGQFPDEDDSTLFTETTVDEAMKRGKVQTDKSELLSCDVARFGKDKITMCRISRGNVTFESSSKQATTVTTRAVYKRAVIYGSERVVIDADGVGGGVFDQLKELNMKGLNAFHGGEKALERIAGKKTELKFLNKRAQAYYYLSKDIKRLSLPRNERLREELLATDMFIKNGVICIVSKDDIKLIIGRSPDEADALAYANYGRYLKSGDITAMKRI